MSCITIVHISDIHIHSKDDKTIDYFQYFLDAISREYIKTELILILVSGDIAFSGHKDEYEKITPIFEKLADDLHQKFATPVKWIMVPGNHDGRFKDAQRTRDYVISGILKDGASSIDQDVIDTCVAPQNEYFDFENKFSTNSDYIFKDKLLGIKEFSISGKTVSFWEINASWMSRIPEQQGSLVFPIDRYQNQLKKSVDLRFAVLHHPLNWYAQDSYHSLRKVLLGNFCGVFSGHEHVSNGHIQKSIGQDKHCVFLEAGALGPHNKTDISSFCVFILNSDNGSIKQTIFGFDSIKNEYLKTTESPKEIQIQLSPSKQFQPTEATTSILEELGAPFTHPSRDELKLSDVYVEPEFSTFTIEDKPQQTIKGREIYEKISSLGHILIRGDEHHGKTSFLSQLFARALIVDIVPVRVSAKELSSGSEEKRDRIIEERVIEHYGHSANEHYKSLSREKRLALVDDFDNLGMNVEQYERALNYIKETLQNPANR